VTAHPETCEGAKKTRLRALNTPRAITVKVAEDGAPSSIVFGKREVSVSAQLESWLVEDEWWRDKPIARRYWRVTLDDGRTTDIYHDLAGGGWFRQSYG
jgi:hypothetical protein